MNIVFAGTPPFAAPALEALIRAGHAVKLVLTQPDRPAGRGLKLVPSAVKRVALEHGLVVEQPPTLRDPGVAAGLAALKMDAMIVAAYGLVLPPAVLALPPHGCINIHASLLPRWRGAAPIQRAILAGDTQSGITIMHMDAGLDTGPILLQQAVPIASADTAQTLHDRLAALGAKLIVEALAHRPAPRPQDEAASTYALKIDKREATIDWNEDAENVSRKVRAFNPVPGAATSLTGAPIKLWHALPVAARSGSPGAILEAGSDGVLVACGRGSVRITELQRAGGKRLSAAAFLAGNPLAPGGRFGA